MFTNGPIEGVVFKPLKQYSDPRGWLVELFRDDELSPNDRPRMGYVSETLPGVARGPHEHVDQSDYFLFLGPGDFKLYLWDAREASPTFRRRVAVVVGQSNRQAVLIPPGVVHAYQSIGETPGWVINCPNRLYAGEGRKQPVDEIRHEADPDTIYVLD
jgi:dTDP-4-dehydrorhamnose 3,5-epimerase